MKSLKLRQHLVCGGGAILVALLLFPAAPASAANFVPNLRADDHDAMPGDGACLTASGWCTLRAAVEEANALPGADTMILISGVYRLKRAMGELVIGDDLDIFGGGTKTARIIGNKPYRAHAGHRVFHVLSPATVAISNVAVRRAGPNLDCGGGVRVDAGASLTLNNVDVRRNISSANGGGICNFGTLTLSNVLLNANRVFNSTDGAGFYNAGTATVTDLAAWGNWGAVLGGAISNAPTGNLVMEKATLWRNRATRGAGVWLASTSSAAISNTTIAQNYSVDSGAGVYNDGSSSVELTNVTLNANKANLGGAIGGTQTSIENVILANSRSLIDDLAQNNCESAASIVSLGHNLDSAATCALAGSGDLSNSDPLLASLRNYGGLTMTQALQAGSPAIDAGDGVNCPVTDQRTAARVGTCDIGAYEYAP